MKKYKKIIILFIVIILEIFIYIQYQIQQTKTKIYSDIEKIPEAQTGLLLGARVYTNGNLSDILRDRTKTAIELYKNNKIQKILISGDHGQDEYDEVNAVKEYLLENGIPAEDIFLDHAGFDTYDSIYRAKAIFEVDSITIITQEFHLPRSLYIAEGLDIPANGFIADKQTYVDAIRLALREKLAQVKAFLNITFNAQPKFLGEQISITGDSQLSWD